MTDKYIGRDIGIYHVEYLCDKLTADGHKLYHAKCRYCEFESDMKISNVKFPKICKHKTRTGRVITFKPLWNNHRLEGIYRQMIDRCYSAPDKSYRWYGDKGIKVCQEWLNNPKSFEEWAMQNGYADNLTIDRIDATKNYCPDNCRWIPLKENVRRAGKVNWITINNETLTGRQWAERLQVGLNAINTAFREHGEEKAKELISAMLKNPPSAKTRKANQSWFDVYGIQV